MTSFLQRRQRHLSVNVRCISVATIDDKLSEGQPYVMRPKSQFREDKATQVASRLLQLSDGEMDTLKLVKLVYLIDRKALLTFGRPVTFDRFFCMTHGPVVSSTLDCIKHPNEEGTGSYWLKFFAPRKGTSVRLLRTPGSDQLSRAEELLVNEVHEEFGHMKPWELVDYTHTLPEWKDPSPARRGPLRYEDVLRAEGWTEEDIKEATDILAAEIHAVRVFG